MVSPSPHAGRWLAYLFCSEDGFQWLKLYLTTTYLCRKHGTPISRLADAEVYVIGDFAQPTIQWLIDQKYSKSGHAFARWIQLLVPLLVDWWWEPRSTILGNVKVLSERDFKYIETLVQRYPRLYQLTHGLFVIVLEDGYRVVKCEHKNVAQSGRKTAVDFSKEGRELDEYPRCRELLKDIHRAFELFKGCKVTHGSIQQEAYVSAFSPDSPGRRDHHLLLQYHAFPLRVPLYTHGSKEFFQQKKKKIKKVYLYVEVVKNRTYPTHPTHSK